MVQNQGVKAVQSRNAYLVPFVQGAIAGFVGTFPMTVFMLVMHRILPKWQQYALPPEEITDELAERADLEKHMDDKQRVGAALVSHFGYGSAMGVLYSTFTRTIPLPSALKGTLFGLAVWAGSYLGLLPALKIPVSADEEPVRRNLLMIAAHVIWGSTTGVVADMLKIS